MYRICICDDEALHREKTKKALLEYSFATNREFSIDEYETPQPLYENADKFDIIFLDIDFPGREPGIEVGKKLREAGVQSIIVFQTAYPEYSLAGYEAEAFRYLLKPITNENVADVMDAIFSKWERSQAAVSIKIQGGTILLDTSRILRIETEGRKQQVYCDTGIIETWEPLKELAEKLPDWSFAYAHQGCLVNLKYVREVRGNTVLLADNSKVMLSRRQKRAFVLGIDKMLEHDK